MGMLDKMKAHNEKIRARAGALQGLDQQVKVETTKGTLKITAGGQLMIPTVTGLKDIEKVDLELVVGETSTKMSAGRIAAGGVLFGPAGAIIGAMAKKAKSNAILLVTIEGNPRQITLELEPGQAPYAERFLTKLAPVREALLALNEGN